MSGDEVGKELSAAWAENDRLRAFLRSLEWSGTSVVYFDGAEADSCPACGGIKPGEATFDAYADDWTFGHEPNCTLEVMLAPVEPSPGRPPPERSVLEKARAFLDDTPTAISRTKRVAVHAESPDVVEFLDEEGHLLAAMPVGRAAVAYAFYKAAAEREAENVVRAGKRGREVVIDADTLLVLLNVIHELDPVAPRDPQTGPTGAGPQELRDKIRLVRGALIDLVEPPKQPASTLAVWPGIYPLARRR